MKKVQARAARSGESGEGGTEVEISIWLSQSLSRHKDRFPINANKFQY